MGYNPINYRYITNKNHSEIGLMFTNLANELGHHPVPIIIVYQLYTNYIGFTK